MMKQMTTAPRRAFRAAFVFTSACVLLAACTTTDFHTQPTAAAARREINASADATMSRLYDVSPNARALVARANGVLIFPDVNKVSFVVGGEHGDGVLREHHEPVSYYTIGGGSIGYQAGAQSKAVVLLFMTPGALEHFRNSRGWTVGADATLAVASFGANASINTESAKRPVIEFVLNNEGLMAGVSLQGTKITPIRLG